MAAMKRMASKRGPAPFRQLGFTLVELVLVLVLLAVLSVVAIPSLSGGDGLKSHAFGEQVRATLRFAQKTAVSHRRLVCATFSASSVTLSIATVFPASACNTAMPSPTGAAAYASSSSSTINITPSLPTTAMYFQPSGNVTSDAAGTTIVTPVLAISDARSITIYGDTGYVN